MAITTSGPWQEILPCPNKLAMVAVQTSPARSLRAHDHVAVWAVAMSGDVIYRFGVTAAQPQVSLASGLFFGGFSCRESRGFQLFLCLSVGVCFIFSLLCFIPCGFFILLLLFVCVGVAAKCADLK